MLTAEFIHGCRVDDVESIKKMGLDVADVSQPSMVIFLIIRSLHFLKIILELFQFWKLVCLRWPKTGHYMLNILKFCQVASKMVKAFGEQIFGTGFIHGDPHSSNSKCR